MCVSLKEALAWVGTMYQIKAGPPRFLKSIVEIVSQRLNAMGFLIEPVKSEVGCFFPCSIIA